MAKKTQGTDTKRHDIAVPPENRQLDKSIARYIIRALLLMILFAWALMNLDAVMKFLGKVISLFSPPMMPARPMGFSPSAMTSIPGLSGRTVPSSVVRLSPSTLSRTTILPEPT